MALTKDQIQVILDEWREAIAYTYEAGGLPPGISALVTHLIVPDGGLFEATRLLSRINQIASELDSEVSDKIQSAFEDFFGHYDNLITNAPESISPPAGLEMPGQVPDILAEINTGAPKVADE